MSSSSFEDFFAKVFSLSPQDYLNGYRNDYSWYFLEMFRQYGLEPFLYLPSFNESGLHQTHDGYAVRFLPLAPWLRRLVSLRIWRGTYLRYLLGVLNALAFLKPLRKALAEDAIDVLYVQEYWHPRFDVMALTMASRLPIVGADHGAVKKQNFTGFKRFSLQRAAALTTQSAEEAESLRRYGVHPHVLPNPVDTDFYSPDPNGNRVSVPGEKHVLTVARLTNAQKRTSDLIEAMQYLDQSWRLTIVGDGPDREMLEQLAHDKGVMARIQFLGFIKDRSKVRDLYRSSDVFCLPSAMEGLAMVALETMSCEMAVVLTPAPAFKTLIQPGQNGILAPVASPRELARCIEDAYGNRQVLGRAARSTVVEKYSRSNFMRRLNEEVIPGRPAVRNATTEEVSIS